MPEEGYQDPVDQESMGGGAPPETPGIYGGGSRPMGRPMGRAKNEVPECPQWIRIDQNGALDLRNHLVDPLGAQDPQKYSFWEPFFFLTFPYFFFMGGAAPIPPGRDRVFERGFLG